MNRRLWTRFLLFYLSVVLLSVGAVAVYTHLRLRAYLLENREEDLHRNARTLAPLLFAAGPDASLDGLCQSLRRRSGYRVTVIDPAGRVLGDSERPAASMENHLYRPEIQEALHTGSGSIIRYSHTLSYSMMYGAILAEEGPRKLVVRLALPLVAVSEELSRIRRSVIGGSLVAFLLAAPVLYLLSRRVSLRIERIRNFVRNARKGELGRRLFVGSRDELGDLERELDEAAGELNEQVDTLTAERKRLASILDAMQDGILLVDDRERILYANPFACQIVGHRVDAVVGRRLMEVARSEELHELLEGAKGPDGLSDSQDLVLLSDPDRAFTGRAKNLPDAAGERAGARLLMLRDVSEQKRLEKIRADLISRISHELRTPLTLIKGFAETLQEEGFQDPGTSDRYLSVIVENTDRMVRLVGDLVRLTSIELGRLPMRPEPVRIEALVRRAVHAFEVRARDKGLELHCDVPEGLPAVLADPDRLTEILYNLLDNAIKYTETGEIRVSAALQQGDPGAPAKVFAPSPGGGDEDWAQFIFLPPGQQNPARRVTVQVSDSGRGIPPRELPRVTERFYRCEGSVSDTRKGYGLGLAIVKHLVRRMGGQLSIRSRPGEGTTVRITLPEEPPEETGPTLP